MSYTIKKDYVIFELDLSDYLGKSYGRSNQDWKPITNIQELEEDIFTSFESFALYIEKDNLEYIDKSFAIKYLKLQGFKDDEIKMFDEVLDSDLLRAMADAKDNSYQSEWIERFMKQAQENIDEDLENNLEDIDYELIDRLDDDDFFKKGLSEQDYLGLKVSKADIKKVLEDNDDINREDLKQSFLDESYIDIFHDYHLDYDKTQVNTEHIDYYGVLGDYDDWLMYFKDYNEIEDIIKDYRKDEKDKQNNLERASLELKPSLEHIQNYIDKYISIEPGKTKITRQIKALKSIIKNAD